MYVKDVDLLSELLGLPLYMVFKEEGGLSDVCVAELANAVALPVGYSFSSEYRVPQAGDYFLDLELLTYEQRLVVYKSKTEGSNKRIIMKHAANSFDDSNYAYKKVNFNLDTCVQKDSSQAKLGPSTVLLTSPYVDATGHVSVVDAKRLLIVHIEELRNMPKGKHSTNRLNLFFNLSSDDRRFIDRLRDDISGLN